MTVVLAHAPSYDTAGPALDAALEQARFRGSSVVAVNVTVGEAPYDPKVAEADDLAELERRAADAGVTLTVERPTGDAASAVLEAAERHGAALVVLGVRRRSAVGKLLMGSVSQQVILGADCAVLGVKAPQ